MTKVESFLVLPFLLIMVSHLLKLLWQLFLCNNDAGVSWFAPANGFPQGTGLSLPAGSEALGSLTLPFLRQVIYQGIMFCLFKNLSPDFIIPHVLFMLYGVCGYVHRVKIILNKKECDLVLMADTSQAHLAMNHLSGQRLYGKVLHTTLSKHQAVQIPREGQEVKCFTKDFNNIHLPCIQKPGSKTFQGIFPPSSTLHLSNILPSVTMGEEHFYRSWMLSEVF